MMGCNPPTPAYDDIVQWGVARAQSPIPVSSDPGLVQASHTVAASMGFAGAAVAAGVTGVAVASALAPVIAGSAVQLAVFPFAAVAVGGATGASAGVVGGEVAGLVAASSAGVVV